MKVTAHCGIELAGKHGGRSSAGRAPGCGPGCRGFEPRRSPHFLKAESNQIDLKE